MEENLFVRKQLTLFQERKSRPRRTDDSTRWTMATLSRFFRWRRALVNVKPDTFTRWHSKGFRLLRCWKSKPMGRRQLPKRLRQLIRRIAADNQRAGPSRTPDPQQRWPTFTRNHATTIVACDFCAVVTVSSLRCKYS